MNRPVPRRLPSAFTRFARLLARPERVAVLFRARRTGARSAQLFVEAPEERVVPDGRPLPGPVIFAGAGDAGVVRAYDAGTGAPRWRATPFGPAFAGGVRVAAGDITGDGVPDAVVAPGPGAARVAVLDGATGVPVAGPLGTFLPFGSGLLRGAFVAAGDVDGGGRQDAIVAAVTPAGPRVEVFGGRDGRVLADFAVSGAAFAGEVTVAAADLTGDGRAEVAVGGSAGGRVRVYDPRTGAVLAGPRGHVRARRAPGRGVHPGRGVQRRQQLQREHRHDRPVRERVGGAAAGPGRGRGRPGGGPGRGRAGAGRALGDRGELRHREPDGGPHRPGVGGTRRRVGGERVVDQRDRVRRRRQRVRGHVRRVRAPRSGERERRPRAGVGGRQRVLLRLLRGRVPRPVRRHHHVHPRHHQRAVRGDRRDRPRPHLLRLLRGHPDRARGEVEARPRAVVRSAFVSGAPRPGAGGS